MGYTTGIEWTDRTWNPWIGCRKVSAGCKNCYMFREQERYGKNPNAILRSKTTFNAPLKWKEPAMVFTCSWSDFFLEQADEWRMEAWSIIRATPHLTYQILTKRPELVADRLPPDWDDGYPNVWLGVSTEDQKTFDERMEILAPIPAKIKFASAEPLLGPIDMSLRLSWYAKHVNTAMLPITKASPFLDWVIAGGESGPQSRPIHPDWIRSIRDQCASAAVPFFFKQWGEWLPADQDPSIVGGYGLCGSATMKWWHVGRKQAGNKLDGQTYQQFPGGVNGR